MDLREKDMKKQLDRPILFSVSLLLVSYKILAMSIGMSSSPSLVELTDEATIQSLFGKSL